MNNLYCDVIQIYEIVYDEKIKDSFIFLFQKMFSGFQNYRSGRQYVFSLYKLLIDIYKEEQFVFLLVDLAFFNCGRCVLKRKWVNFYLDILRNPLFTYGNKNQMKECNILVCIR